MIEKFKVTDVTYHRNGIAGRPFYSVRFSFEAEATFYPNMVAIMPAESKANDYECFVLSLNDPTASWRGDNFAKDVRKAIKKHSDELSVRFSATKR